jgi:hypothetical protein
MHIIEQEGARVGLSRGQFLTMLVKQANGDIGLVRAQNAPSYEVEEKELSETQLYVWQVLNEVRDLIDRERLRMGNVGVAAYLIYLVNDWLGAPHGLPFKKSKKKSK